MTVKAKKTSAAKTVRVMEVPKRGILDQLLGYQIRRAQTRLFAHFEEHLQHLKITPGQLGLLVMISANPGINQVALARAVGIERATLGEFVDRFEREKLVERRGLIGDRRSYALHLTRRGQEFLDEAIPAVMAHESAFTDHFTAVERATLLKLLAKMVDRP
ncbi:MarR family winged helix-turn-helix transcriptional regulator [Povalibacter sp.]|uniref:MarR family winged helix-turn-helix transcriptional regulator n=1 Tax=Povalibacter sp. TaxID=1962978 RepID=UPI002F414115